MNDQTPAEEAQDLIALVRSNESIDIDLRLEVCAQLGLGRLMSASLHRANERIAELERDLPAPLSPEQAERMVYALWKAPAPEAEGLREAVTACTAAHENKYNCAIPHASELDDAILSAVAPFVGTEDKERLDWVFANASIHYHKPKTPCMSIVLLEDHAAIDAARQSAQGGGK